MTKVQTIFRTPNGNYAVWLGGKFLGLRGNKVIAQKLLMRTLTGE